MLCHVTVSIKLQISWKAKLTTTLSPSCNINREPTAKVRELSSLPIVMRFKPQSLGKHEEVKLENYEPLNLYFGFLARDAFEGFYAEERWSTATPV